MITSRSRYALKIMMDLAGHPDEPQQKRMDISNRHGIPSDYMDHILASLREAGLLESIRGRNGGLRLARPADAISAWEIFSAVEVNLSPVACIDDQTDCAAAAACISRGAWEEIYRALRLTLSSFKLNDLVAKYGRNDYNALDIVAAVATHECKAPRKAIGGAVL
jgi:Rrf2 family protein